MIAAVTTGTSEEEIRIVTNQAGMVGVGRIATEAGKEMVVEMEIEEVATTAGIAT